jgi:hypothetical protein
MPRELENFGKISFLNPVLRSFFSEKGMEISMRDEMSTTAKMTNEALLLKTELAVKTERRSTSEVVRLFQEISNRKLYLERGFPNLYEMATKHFGYCAGSAMRRINAMRLTSIIPGVESKLESGELSLSVASEVQSFFCSEAKEDRPYSLNAKIELIETCLNKSRREVERELVRRNPEREKRESIRHTSIDRVRVSFSISEELNQKLNRLKDLLSQTNPSTEDLLDRLAELGLDKFDPERKAARAESRRQVQKSATSPSSQVSSKEFDKVLVQASADLTYDSLIHSESQSSLCATTQVLAQASVQVPPPSEVAHLPSAKIEEDHGVAPIRPISPAVPIPSPLATPPKRSRYIPSRERHIMKRHEEGCTYVDVQTGRRCGHTKFLERDHIDPYSHGGANTAENLRWVCSAHNKWSYAAGALNV